MNKDLRVQYFSSLLTQFKNGEKTAHGTMDLWYKNARRNLPVFEIDLKYLVYNPYNGRIASMVKSYEKQEGVKLDNTKPTDIDIIEKFLWRSSGDANKSTKKDIADKGQLKYGIITKDGVIIDGNRRASILKKIAAERQDSPVYFLAVVLDEELNENPAEIMRLETTYQMGEDAKVDYNAIEKYLKCKDLIEENFKPGEIGKMMSVSEATITEYLSILNLMDEYLDKNSSAGIYTRLDKTEGAFVDLNNYIDRYKNKRSRMIQWNYKDVDVNDLKLIYFDYIRSIYNSNKKSDEEAGVQGSGDAKDYRFIGQTSKKGSFFSNEEIWEEFKEEHFKALDPIREEFEENGKYSVENLRKDHPDMKLEEILKSRDELWAKLTSTNLKKNLNQSKYKLDLKNQHVEPLELLKRAKNTIESIDPNSKGLISQPAVAQILSDITKLTAGLQEVLIKQPQL